MSARTRFNISLIRHVFGLFVLDGLMCGYSKFRTLKLGIRHLFLNSAVIVVNSCLCCGVLCGSVKLLQLTGITATSVGAIMFLKLPA